MIILVADHNALSRELIRELLEGSGQVAEKFGFQQICWYRTTVNSDERLCPSGKDARMLPSHSLRYLAARY